MHDVALHALCITILALQPHACGMSLFRSAKTAASAEAQADARQLAAIYDDMACQLSVRGLNLPAIEAQRCGRPFMDPSCCPDHAHVCACKVPPRLHHVALLACCVHPWRIGL